MVIAGAEVKRPEGARNGPEILATGSVFYPDTEEVMGWDISEKGFRIVLSREVPDVVRQHLGEDVDALLAEHGFTRGEVGSWVMHPAAPKYWKPPRLARPPQW